MFLLCPYNIISVRFLLCPFKSFFFFFSVECQLQSNVRLVDISFLLLNAWIKF